MHCGKLNKLLTKWRRLDKKTLLFSFRKFFYVVSVVQWMEIYELKKVLKIGVVRECRIEFPFFEKKKLNLRTRFLEVLTF